jgi:subtilisin family serine protease
MKTHTFNAITLALGTCLAFGAQAERIIIHTDDAQQAKRLVAQHKGEIKLTAQGFMAVDFKGKGMAELRGLINNPHIKRIERDERRHFGSLYNNSPGSPATVQVTPYNVVQAQADAVSFNPNAMMKVCVIDTGMSPHSDLPFVNITGDDDSGTGLWDQAGHWHGLHVAGTIAAADNGYGIIGMAPGVDLHIVKVFGDNGAWAYSSDLAHATQQCADAGANILNLSLSGGLPNATEEAAFAHFAQTGGLVIASAGNDGTTTRGYPAGYPSVMMIGANNANDQMASFSQHPPCLTTGKGRKVSIDDNTCVEVSAGGVDILSTYKGGGYASASGTSMSAPGVSGVAALVWSNFETCTGEEIRDALRQTARDIGESGHDHKAGYGVVQAKDAYDYLQQVGCAADTSEPELPIINDDLTAFGYKVKGLKLVDLAWFGLNATLVDIYRDGQLLLTTSNSGVHTDSINTKGGGTYAYVVCEQDGSACTSSVTVSF